MTVGFIAVHYPESGHFDAFIERVRYAADAIRDTPGCLSAHCWVTTDGDAVVSTGEWESQEALVASFATAQEAGADFTYDDRERKPRLILRLRAP